MRRQEFIGLRVSTAERRLLRTGAARAGTSESAFVRVAAVDAAQRLVERPTRIASALATAVTAAHEVLGQ
jgi:uncharacterized protein (DUF1778 family)